jgi:hypothetical protein
MSLVEDILKYSKEIQNGRTIDTVWKHFLSEVSELSFEVDVVNGTLLPEYGGEDGLVGEAIDGILCLVDLIYKHNPEITEEELRAIAAKKLEKWKRIYS